MGTSSKHSRHVGHNIQKIRLFRGLSQNGLAPELEEKCPRPVSQHLLSDIEARENIEDEELLTQIAEILHVNPEAFEELGFG